MNINKTNSTLNDSPFSKFSEKLKAQLELAIKEKRIKLRPAVTLFDLSVDWEKVKKGRCGICGTKLTLPKRGKIALCKGLRHPDKRPFIVPLEKLAKIQSI